MKILANEDLHYIAFFIKFSQHIPADPSVPKRVIANTCQDRRVEKRVRAQQLAAKKAIELP